MAQAGGLVVEAPPRAVALFSCSERLDIQCR
jgi:hypothetical protein